MSANKGALWLERTGVRTYVARNDEGAEIPVGEGQGIFDPGELLKIALAACQAMSCDTRLGAALGEDYQMSVGIDANYNKEADRYEGIDIELVTDFSALDAQAQADLVRRATGAIERNCTIGHTLTNTLTYTTTFTDESA